MTPRERMLAVLRGRPHDRVPFVQYSGLAASDAEVEAHLGPGRIGVLRWIPVHRVHTPHCRLEHEDWADARAVRLRRTTLRTPAGSLVEERQFEPAYGSSSIRRHFVQQPADYAVLVAYLRDAVILDNYEAYRELDAALGPRGLPLPAVERSPYQQLWVQWAGLENLAWHLAECPERVHDALDLLAARARRVVQIAARSPASFVDVPDNITAPAIGPERFRRHCVPIYRELGEGMGEDRPVLVHMDGDLRPLWPAIAEGGIGGIDSLSPPPDNDTSVAAARRMWPGMRLWVNFPSSLHLGTYDAVRAAAERILTEDGRSGLLQVQVSENVPRHAWRTSYRAIADAVDAFGS